MISFFVFFPFLKVQLIDLIFIICLEGKHKKECLNQIKFMESKILGIKLKMRSFNGLFLISKPFNN